MATPTSPPPVSVTWVTWRVLACGSRTWSDIPGARAWVARVWHPDATLVVGACRKGADALIERCWRRWGGRVERHPAQWTAPCRSRCDHGGRRFRKDGTEYCPAAGDYRNEYMVSLGADVCLALIEHRSAGASHCASVAARAGIPVCGPDLRSVLWPNADPSPSRGDSRSPATGMPTRTGPSPRSTTPPTRAPG